MESDGIDGWWWLPSVPDRPRFGRFFAGRAGDWRLDIFGGLDEGAEQLPGIRIGQQLPTAPVIHGHLTGGAPGPRFVTLLGCRQQSANRTYGVARDEPTESWTFDEVIRGYENVDSDELAVAVRVRLANLLEWSGRTRPRLDWTNDNARAEAVSVQIGEAVVPGAVIVFTLDHSASESAHEVTLRHQALFEVVPDEPLAFGEAMSRFALPLRSMLSFLTLGHVDVDSVSMKLERHQDDQRGIWFDYRTRLQRPFNEPKLPQSHEMLATWPHVAEMTIQGLVAGWYSLIENNDVEKAITYLLIPHHAPYLYTDDHLLTAFVATEAYHRARFDQFVMKPDDFQRRVDSVVAAAPEHLRNWTREKLSDRNQKGLKKRLGELVDHAGATSGSIIESCPKFVDLAVASRGQIAHPGGGGESGAKYLAVSYGLRWMLRHCLLVDLGLDEARTADLIGSSKRFGDELELIGRWTSGL